MLLVILILLNFYVWGWKSRLCFALPKSKFSESWFLSIQYFSSKEFLFLEKGFRLKDFLWISAGKTCDELYLFYQLSYKTLLFLNIIVTNVFATNSTKNRFWKATFCRLLYNLNAFAISESMREDEKYNHRLLQVI